jgi:hypothetical protein
MPPRTAIRPLTLFDEKAFVAAAIASRRLHEPWIYAPANAADFQRWTRRLPSAETPPFSVSWKRDGAQLTAKISPPAGTTAVEFFPLPGQDEIIGHTTSVRAADGMFTVGVESKTDLPGVLAIKSANGERAWTVITTPIPNPTSEIKIIHSLP